MTRVLIDTGCDLREQLLDADVDRVDAVLYTHDHADHTHGIDDLRVLALNARRRVDGLFHRRNRGAAARGVRLLLQTPPGSDYPPILDPHRIVAGEKLVVDGAGGQPSPSCPSRRCTATSSRSASGSAISPIRRDLNDLADEALPHLAGLDVWIVDALRYKPHPSHFSLADALGWIERLKPKRAVLTNLHIDLDYETLDRETPDNVTPAYDGMRIEVGAAVAAGAATARV